MQAVLVITFVIIDVYYYDLVVNSNISTNE